MRGKSTYIPSRSLLPPIPAGGLRHAHRTQSLPMVRVASWRVVGAYGSGETCAVVSLHGTQIGFRPGLVRRKPNRFSWNCVAWLCGPGPASASLEREGTRTALRASRACLDPDPAHPPPFPLSSLILGRPGRPGWAICPDSDLPYPGDEHDACTIPDSRYERAETRRALSLVAR